MSKKEVSSMPAKVILIAVSDSQLEKLISMTMRELGFSTLSTDKGREALKITKKEKIDVVICDIHLPPPKNDAPSGEDLEKELDGVRLLESLRALDSIHPYFIFVTSVVDISLVDAYNLGATAVFAKPLDISALTQVVHRCILASEHKKRRVTRVPSTFTVELKIPPKPQRHVIRTRDIGHGGMFIAWNDELPKVGDQLDFSLFTAGKNDHSVQGTAICRWMRPAASGDLPRGFGVEFMRMDKANENNLVQLLNEAQTAIPISRWQEKK